MSHSNQIWIDGPEFTATGVLRARVAETPDALFLDFSGERTTYGEFDLATTRLANALRALGAAPGTCIATMLDNNLDCVLAWFAISKLGAVWVPVNTAFKGQFLRHQLNDSEAELIIVEPDYADRIASLSDSLVSLKRILYRGTEAPTVSSSLVTESLEQYRDGGDATIADVNEPADVMCLYYTGGTTGPSKGCMISHNYLMTVSQRILNYTDRRSEERIWNCMPLYHMNSSSSIAASMLIGSSASIASRFSVSGFWSEIERSGARHCNLLGVMVPLLAQAPDSVEMKRCHGQLRVVYAVPFPPPLVETFKERFGVEICVFSSYGLTEACPITYAMPNEQIPGAAGTESEDFDVRIFDNEDREVGPDTVGEIVCRPRRRNVMFNGYWNRPEATQATMSNLWFHSGDLGHFDDEGHLYFDDRKKDYLRRGGENISSVEVELTLLEHPAISEVAVYAVPSELSEDELKVAVVLTEGHSLTERELCLWAIDQLPYFAVPRYIEFRDALPTSPLGRVQKYRLREEDSLGGWDRLTSDVVIPRR